MLANVYCCQGWRKVTDDADCRLSPWFSSLGGIHIYQLYYALIHEAVFWFSKAPSKSFRLLQIGTRVPGVSQGMSQVQISFQCFKIYLRVMYYSARMEIHGGTNNGCRNNSCKISRANLYHCALIEIICFVLILCHYIMTWVFMESISFQLAVFCYCPFSFYSRKQATNNRALSGEMSSVPWFFPLLQLLIVR